MLKKITALLMFLFIAMGISGAVFILNAYKEFTSESPLAYDKNIVIPKGASLSAVSKILHNEQVISSELNFKIMVKAFGNSRLLKAGEFRFPARVTAENAMRIIIRGETVARSITFPEGVTSYQVVQTLFNTEDLEGDIYAIPKDGTILPETYHYSLGDTRQSIIDRMQNAMIKAKEEAWETKTDKTFVKSIDEAVILASIVEKETSIDEERGVVAGVFVNRLKKRMRLQSDPTVIYALSDGKGDLERPLSKKDLRTKHPYNTYTEYGLPPSPICNPGKASIMAAIHPEKTKALYFVADGTGGHVFANSLKEHNINVQKWRRIEKQRKNK